MDGMKDNNGILFFVVINRIDVLDFVLICFGRFDRIIIVGFLDVKECEEIFNLYVKGKRVLFNVNFV